MNPGDMVVCAVTSDFLIEDISIIVPKGNATTIPAAKVVTSKDLYRGLSQGMLFQLNRNSLLHLARNEPQSDELEALKRICEVAHNAKEMLQAENEALKSKIAEQKTQIEALQSSNNRAGAAILHLQAQVKTYTDAEVTGKAVDDKLEAILTAVKERPTVVNNVVGGRSVAKETEVVGGDVPHFIPSSIRQEGGTDRISVREETTEGSSVAAASKQLKRMNKS